MCNSDFMDPYTVALLSVLIIIWGKFFYSAFKDDDEVIDRDTERLRTKSPTLPKKDAVETLRQIHDTRRLKIQINSLQLRVQRLEHKLRSGK